MVLGLVGVNMPSVDFSCRLLYIRAKNPDENGREPDHLNKSDLSQKLGLLPPGRDARIMR